MQDAFNLIETDVESYCTVECGNRFIITVMIAFPCTLRTDHSSYCILRNNIMKGTDDTMNFKERYTRVATICN